jgi:hypothetical protein
MLRLREGLREGRKVLGIQEMKGEWREAVFGV